MKENNRAQLSAGTNSMFPENSFYLHLKDEIIYSPEPYGYRKLKQLQDLLFSLTGSNRAASTSGDITKLIPAMAITPGSAEYPAKSFDLNEVRGLPFSSAISLKETAARLSEIELAIDNYDIYSFQFAVHALKGLLINIKLITASRIAGQMEELSKENSWQELNTMLRSLKKIIAQVVNAPKIA